MLKNDIRYILKRVIAAILIAMIIFFLKSHNVLALSYDMSAQDEFFIFNSAKALDWYSRNTDNNYTFKEAVFDNNYTNTEDYDFMVIPIISNVTYYANGSVVAGQYATAGLSDVIFRVVLVSNSNWSTCELQNNFVVCPIKKDLVYSAIRFYYVSPMDITEYGVKLRINNTASFYNSVYSQQNSMLNSIATSQQQIANDQMDNSNVTTSDVDVSQMSGVQGILPAGPVDSLLSLPLTLINLLISGTSGSCTPFTFTFVFDETFTLPCFDTFWNQVPSSMMIFLSDLPAVYIFIKWAKSIYSRVERAVSFESSVDDEWGGV